MTELLTAKEVAAVLRVDIRTVYRYAERGTLTPVRVGNGTLRFRRADVEALTEPGGVA